MYNLNVLVDCVFPDLALPKRVGPIVESGYKKIETWQSDKEVLQEIGAACKEHNADLISIVVNAPNGAETALVTPETHGTFLETLDQASDNALAVGCKQGIVCTGNAVVDAAMEPQKTAVISVLKKAHDLVAPKGFNLVLEALNTRVDHAGYFLDDPDLGFDIIRAVNSPRIKLLYDIYHMGVQERNIKKDISENIDLIGHFHAAGVPGRKDVFTGDLEYPPIMQVIAKTGYEGCVGLEYFPSIDSAESLVKSLEIMSRPVV